MNLVLLMLVVLSSPGVTRSDPPKLAGGYLQVDDFVGADWGARVAGCIAALPHSGGVCDARTLGGDQSVTKALTIAKDSVQILVGAASVVVEAGGSFAITGSNVAIVGLGKGASSFVLTSRSFDIGSASVVARKWTLSGIGITASSRGQHAKIGLSLVNAREGRLSDVLISGFGGDN